MIWPQIVLLTLAALSVALNARPRAGAATRAEAPQSAWPTVVATALLTGLAAAGGFFASLGDGTGLSDWPQIAFATLMAGRALRAIRAHGRVRRPARIAEICLSAALLLGLLSAGGFFAPLL